MNPIRSILLILLVLINVLLAAWNLSQLGSYNRWFPPTENNFNNDSVRVRCPYYSQNDTASQNTTKSTYSQPDQLIAPIQKSDGIIVRGIIKKEKIPTELELGTGYWYWIYFDEPFLNKSNASGWPLYENKMQVTIDSNNPFYVIDDFLNSQVEIYGNMTTGYAESNVISISAIAKL